MFEGHDIAGLGRHERRQVARDLQYCYQDPGASLDPRWTIAPFAARAADHPYGAARGRARARVREILRAVGLPETHLDLYPHEISGGQQRRVGLARILTLKPQLVILDEPTSGLDVSVQATVLNLFLDLPARVRPDLPLHQARPAVVRLICDRVAVMYLGRIVEIGETSRCFRARPPLHASLLAAIPQIGGPRVTETFSLEGEPPTRSTCPRAAASAPAARRRRRSAPR